MTPAQSLLAGFVLLTLAGSWLLTLPISSARDVRQPFVDSFFTATSAITTTGLVVVDTGSYYSLFGQLVILALFQIGGLGYMAFIVFLASLLGSRVSLRAGLTIEESLAGIRYGELKDFVKAVFLFTFALEGIGAVGLGLYWMRDLPAPRAFYQGLFHSVSAFCTAGFSLFADSFVSYRDSITVNILIACVTIAGGIGFFVLRDLLQYGSHAITDRRPRRLSVHTRLTLLVSIVLMLAGSVIVFVSERHTAPGLSVKQRALAASFQALSASTTTGFNSVDIARMTESSLFALIILMFVGAGPGGTGGGIKTTTLGVVLAAAIALLKGRQDVVAFRRRLPQDTVYRALTIGMVGTIWIVATALLLTATEGVPFLKILFEVVSALGTVGLSMGITANLTAFGKVVIAITMLAGRLGPLAVGFALVGRPRRVPFRWLEEKVFVG